MGESAHTKFGMIFWAVALDAFVPTWTHAKMHAPTGRYSKPLVGKVAQQRTPRLDLIRLVDLATHSHLRYFNRPQYIQSMGFRLLITSLLTYKVRFLECKLGMMFIPFCPFSAAVHLLEAKRAALWCILPKKDGDGSWIGWERGQLVDPLDMR